MRVKRLACLGLLLLGCGGTTDNSIALAGGGLTSIVGQGGSSSLGPNAGSGGFHIGGQSYSTYTAIGCPDAASPAVYAQCDLFSSVSGCPAGQACYPTTRATADPCQPEQYYYMCSRAGNGAQGDDCTSSNDCAQGFVCVVTNAGTMCQQMCALSGTTSCSPGMRCYPIDVVGVGTCY